MPTQTESTAQVRAAEVKWQTVLPAIWSQRRRDVGCATATVATDANVVTMSPDVALLAGKANLRDLIAATGLVILLKLY